MTNEQLCRALMEADTGEEVVAILKGEGYWDDDSLWRYVGDNENNFSTIGNQQAEGVAALAEKIVNSIDARLLLMCLLAGIDPSSVDAPPTTRAAVAQFLEAVTDASSARAGRISEWDDKKILREGKNITFAATGSKTNPSISIADTAHGAAPDDFSETFLSLNKKNKLRIPFVQGKFNMGGTGALQFCGKPYNFQLVVARRSPVMATINPTDRADEWGFTIIRRESHPGTRSSIFTYLAPLEAHDRTNGKVLSFASDDFKILPEASGSVRGAYEVSTPHGSLIKLYEYGWDGGKSNIVFSGGGLRQRLEQALPQLALPVRVYECRPDYKGNAGSFATNLTGLAVRLERDRADKLEEGSPATHIIDIEGQEIRVSVFVFKSDVDVAEYRTPKNAVTFIVNGQTHATVSQDFFSRKSVNLGYIDSSLMVLLDCTNLDQRTREDLFLNSRDRFRDNHLSKQILTELESLLHEDQYLRDLNNRRKKEAVEAKLADDKPLADVLRTLLKSSPTLEKLFLKGQAISAPFGPEGTGTGSGETFVGKTYPTFFRFKGKKQGDSLERDAQLGSSPRVVFETDAVDDYFTRDLDQAELTVYRVDGGVHQKVDRRRLTGPRSGVVSLSLNLPAGICVGDTLTIEIEATDPSRVDPFVNTVVLNMKPAGTTGGNGTGHTRTSNRGNGNSGGEGTLSLPNVVKVKEADWGSYSFHTFTPEDALWIVTSSDEDDRQVYDFFINVDNKYLKTVQKDSPRGEPALMEARFVYGNVLIGLAILNDHAASEQSNDDGAGDDDAIAENAAVLVARISRLIAPVLLPMIEELAGLSPEQIIAD